VNTIVVNDIVELSGLSDLNDLVTNPFTVLNPMCNELNIQFDEYGIIRSIVFSVNTDIVAFERSNVTGKFGSNFALSA
jgi:hypothetical protein